MKSRIQYIDMVRGVGILLVVFCHNWIVLHEKGKLFNIIASFVMPLFFLLSGLFFKPHIKFCELLSSKTDSLLKPYFVTLAGLGAFCSIFQSYPPVKYFVGVIYGNGNTILWPPLWFLTNLWLVFTFSWLIVKMTNIESTKLIYRFISLAVLLIAGYYLSHMFWQIPIRFKEKEMLWFGEPMVLWGLPFSIDILLLTSFYFLTGFLMKNRVFDFKHNNYYFTLSVITFSLLHYFFDYTIDFNLRIYSDLIISTIEAFLGIYIVLCLVSLMKKYKIISKVMAYIGSGSLFVYIFHYEIQRSVFRLLEVLIKDSPYFNGLISFILGATIPLLIWEIIKRNDFFAIFWLPLKSNNLFQRVHRHLA